MSTTRTPQHGSARGVADVGRADRRAGTIASIQSTLQLALHEVHIRQHRRNQSTTALPARNGTAVSTTRHALAGGSPGVSLQDVVAVCG